MAARYSVLKRMGTQSDVRAMRGNEMMWRVEDIEGKHMVAAVGFYRWIQCWHRCCCMSVGVVTLVFRWVHTWANCAARRRTSQLIRGRRTHHQLFVAFNSLKHQGGARSLAFDGV